MNKLTSVLSLGFLITAMMFADSTLADQAKTEANIGRITFAQADENKVKKAKDKRVCRRIKVTGSRIKERICRKQSQWDQLEEAARENVQQSYEGSRRNVGTGPAEQ